MIQSIKNSEENKNTIKLYSAYEHSDQCKLKGFVELSKTELVKELFLKNIVKPYFIKKELEDKISITTKEISQIIYRIRHKNSKKEITVDNVKIL